MAPEKKKKGDLPANRLGGTKHNWEKAAREMGKNAVVTNIGLDLCVGTISYGPSGSRALYRRFETPRHKLDPALLVVMLLY